VVSHAIPARPVKAERAKRVTRPAKRKPVNRVPARGTARRVGMSPDERAAAVQFALSQVGQPYRRGGSGSGGWDCSGLVSTAYRKAGVRLPRTSGAIGRRGTAVPPGQWQPGDVIVTRGHVALYLGNGMLVEAANPRKGVRVTKIR
jgi:cell wall-associated NlpC family hydrolase